MKREPPTPYPELNAVLEALVAGLGLALGASCAGVYLQGSFAVGDFDQHSDVDFLVALAAEPTPRQEAALQALHGQLYDRPSSWAQHLEGSYFPLDLLRRGAPGGGPLLYLDNTARQLTRSQHDNTRVVRWVTRERGIVLAGRPPRELIDPVSAEELRAEIRATMRDWGAEISAGRWAMDNRWAQPFAVLSYCRMLHSLATGTVESKLAGARWAAATLDARWAGLIQRAWAARPDPSLKVRQPADPDDLAQTVAFIQYALARGGA